jgi:single-strand DNA-binding protein
VKGLNKAYLIGHAGSDPEMRTSASGRRNVQMLLATPHTRKVGTEWVDTPDWHQLTFYDDNADYVTANCRKGNVIAVECALRPHSWTDKDSVVHTEVVLEVERVLWINSKRQAEAG